MHRNATIAARVHNRKVEKGSDAKTRRRLTRVRVHCQAEDDSWRQLQQEAD